MASITQKPLILAVETSGRTGSVAIAKGKTLLAETKFSKSLNHMAEMFPAINALLKFCDQKPRQINHIYLSVGPGSFTGLRIAVTLAKILNLTNDTRVVAVDTLDVIAQNALGLRCDRIATVLDAKRSQFYIAVYKRNKNNELQDTSCSIWEKILPDTLMTAQQFLTRYVNPGKALCLLGEGLLYYKDKFEVPGIRFFDESYWQPTAANVHQLGYRKALAGEFADSLRLTPNYLRKPDVKLK